MNFKCIVDGCSHDFKAQAEELNGFIVAHGDLSAEGGGTLFFYADKAQRDDLLDAVPTAGVQLIRVERFQPETILAALERVEGQGDADLYLFPSSGYGPELAVRWAFRCHGSSLVQVKEADFSGKRLTAARAAYVDHALATFSLDRRPYCLSPAKGSVDRLPVTARRDLAISEHDLTGLKRDGFVQESRQTRAEPEGRLQNPPFLIVGGRGLGSRENVEQLAKTAAAMGAEFGISRPVAMNTWGPVDRLIGVSGTIARPEICIAAGVSGSAAFYAGIEGSDCIVAINTDPHARIVKRADVVIIDDYAQVMAELLKIFMLDCERKA